jgi:RsiW-degrading membrane proteinase PrsW (M82 family)
MGLLVFALSFLPGLFYMWIVYRQDKYDPEPHGWVAFIFFMGMLSTFPAVVVEQLVDSFIFPYTQGIARIDPSSILFGAYLIVGPVEEMFKLWAVLVVAANSHVFDEPLDGLVYAGAAALGFASLENALYCVQLGSSVYVPRAVMAVPAHLLFAGMWGWGLAFWRFRRGGVLGFVVFLTMFAGACVAHGTYDAMLFSQNPLLIVLTAVLLTLLLVANVGFFWHYRKASPYRWSILPRGRRTMARREAMARRSKGLSIGWIVGGTAIYVAVVVAVLVVLGAVLVVHLGPGFVNVLWDNPMNLLVLLFYGLVLLALLAVCFFLAGMLIGRLSKGRTIIEPAISAVLALSLLTILIPRQVGTWAFVLLVISAPLIFGVGCLGGWLGELWQESSERRRAARAA